MSQKLLDAILEKKDLEAVAAVEKMLAEGYDPNKVLATCQQAMEIVGKRFEEKEFFLPDLIMSGEIMKKIMEVIKPWLKDSSDDKKSAGKIVFGTVEGDIHDIGKDIVIFMLEVNGFRVYDIGVDASPQKFVDKIKEVNPDIVGLSGFLTIAFDSMKKTVEAIERIGLRDKVKIMIGGGTVTEEINDYVRADAYGEDAITAVALSKKWMEEK
ncbi:MAG: cobalamin-dependent protein [Dethiobacteria bacterium]|nr:methionine synthase [Bacillota bacterium]HOJ83319.1 cobalamin-dependent protein [Bacillota bacterium]HOL15323.1 cobalamin-dependent protein [Bacillota bacterium]HQE10580.1 cobalamin-dependent protein [Bacillota bacterium]